MSDKEAPSCTPILQKRKLSDDISSTSSRNEPAPEVQQSTSLSHVLELLPAEDEKMVVEDSDESKSRSVPNLLDEVT